MNAAPEPLMQTEAQVEGCKLADLRTSKRMSQRQLARLLGISYAELSDAENGRLSLEETQALHQRVKGL